MAGLTVGLNIGTSPPLARNRLMTRLARLIGADSVWIVDHFTGWFPQELWTPEFTWLARGEGSGDAYFDWQVLAGYVAGRNPNLPLGVGVTEPIRRHPVLLAQAALTISHMSRRPFILGLGAGEAENTEPYGLSFSRPVSRLEEALQLIRLCFDSRGPVDFAGEFYRLDRAILDLAPGLGGIPEIWIAAHGPRMLELTARYGDGWYPTIPISPDEYRNALGAIRSGAAGLGRDGAGITAALLALYVAAPDEKTARRWLAHPAVRFLALLAPDRVWQKSGLTHPLGVGFRGMVDFVPARHGIAEIEAAIASVPAEMMSDYLLWGTPNQVVHQLRELGDAGLEHVVLAPVAGLVSRRALAYTARTLPGMVRRLRA